MEDISLSEIDNTITELLKSEYEYFDYIDNNEIIKERNININENDAKAFHYKLKNYKRKNQKNDCGTQEYKNLECNQQDHDLINSNIFNVIKDENNYIEWKKLDNVVKIEKLNNYFNNMPNLETKIKDELEKLILDNKINYKKYIEYDKINSNILSMPIICFDEDKCAYLKMDCTTKKKKNKIFFSN